MIRQKLAQCYAEVEIMRANQMRAFSRISTTGVPGPEGSIQKIFWSELNQRLQQVAQELLGPYGQLEGRGPARDRSRRVVVRLPARARQHDRSRHVGNPAQHHRPFRPRPPEKLLMHFGLNENQVILRDSAREFFAGECPIAFVRRAAESATAYDPQLWAQLAAQGYTGIIFDEAYGGVGLGIVELVLLMEEAGRALLPGPLFSTVAMAGAVIDACANREQKQQFLAPIAHGDARSTLAFLEPTSGWDRAALRLTATNGRLSGEKLFVPDAGVANTIVVVARDGVYVVDARAPGVSITPMAGMDLTRKLYAVSLTEVAADKLDAFAGLDRALDIATTALVAEMVGGMQRMLDITVDYAKTRKQFGKPIGIVPGRATSVRGHVSGNGERALGRLLCRRGAAGTRGRRVSRRVDCEALCQRRVPHGGQPRHPGPRWHGFHVGERSASLLPARQGVGDDAGRRHVPSRTVGTVGGGRRRENRIGRVTLKPARSFHTDQRVCLVHNYLSTRRHADSAIQPHAFAVHVSCRDHELGQCGVLVRVAQPLGERY